MSFVWDATANQRACLTSKKAFGLIGLQYLMEDLFFIKSNQNNENNVYISIKFFNNAVTWVLISIMVSMSTMADQVVAAGEHIRPLWLRRWLFSVLYSLYINLRRTQALLTQLRLSVSTVVGESKDGDSLSVLFVGGKTFPSFLSEQFFKNSPQVKFVKKVWIWRIGHISRVDPDVDGLITSCDGFYQRWVEKAESYVFPHFVDMVLDVSEPIEVFFKKSTKSVKADIQKVRKYGYSFEPCPDVNGLQQFYEQMYLPLIRTRHGNARVYTPPFFVFRWLQMMGYRLVLVKNNRGEVITGGYYYANHGMASVRYIGVINGNLDWVRKGAESALYYFFVTHPLDTELRVANFGGARPFFNDGLFWYKKKWGMAASVSNDTSDIFGLRLIGDGGPLRSFLLDNPLIGINKKRELVGYVFVDTRGLSDSEKQDKERFQLPGLKPYTIVL